MDNLTTRTSRRPPSPKRFRRLRTTKKQAYYYKSAKVLTEYIIRLLKKANIRVTAVQRVILLNFIKNNKAHFKPEYMERSGIHTSDGNIMHKIELAAQENNSVDDARDAVLKFDTQMEAFFRRMERGNNIRLAFLRMRPHRLGINHVAHVRVENHWQFGRLIKHIEQIEKAEDRQIISGMFYHTAIDGLHMDCVPLAVGDVPVEWSISVTDKRCDCGCANWERRAFIGREWI